MLVLYKPYDFKFSDIEFHNSDQRSGSYNNYQLNLHIGVLRVSESPDLYDVVLYVNERSLMWSAKYNDMSRDELESYIQRHIDQIKKDKYDDIL